MKKSHQLTLAIIIVASILIIAFAPDNVQNIPGELNKELAECIGENSILYSKLGCSYCDIQEEIFEDNYEYLNVVSCSFEKEKCIEAEITATPTWSIQGEYYKGVQQIEKLKELTGC